MCDQTKHESQAIANWLGLGGQERKSCIIAALMEQDCPVCRVGKIRPKWRDLPENWYDDDQALITWQCNECEFSGTLVVAYKAATPECVIPRSIGNEDADNADDMRYPEW